MTRLLARAVMAVLFLSSVVGGQDSTPFPEEEALYFNINWPSGLSLGEGAMTATLDRGDAEHAARWSFRLRLDAAVPGASIADSISSSATPEFCSVELEKDMRHGQKITRERTEFEAGDSTADRQTLEGGGTTEFAVGECPKDALTFLYFLREQLSRGRIPPAQTVYFGAAYELRLEYIRAEPTQLGSEIVEGDRLRARLEGPASKHTFEIVIGRDPARRPLRIEVPLELGNFTMVLQP